MEHFSITEMRSLFFPSGLTASSRNPLNKCDLDKTITGEENVKQLKNIPQEMVKFIRQLTSGRKVLTTHNLQISFTLQAVPEMSVSSSHAGPNGYGRKCCAAVAVE